MGKLATLTAKSQITIPAEIRRKLGIGPGDRLLLELEEGRAILKPLKGTFAQQMVGLGQEVWEAEGGAEGYLEQEREAWARD